MRDREPQELRDLRRRQHQLEHAAIRGLAARAAVVAQQAQDDREPVVDRQERRDPAAQVVLPRGGVAVQPVVVAGQIELADAAGNRGALLDRHQPFVVAQMHAGLAGLREQRRARAVDVGEQRLEHARLDRGIGAQRREQLLLPLELLQEVGLEIGARGDVGDFEQHRERGVMIGSIGLRGEKLRAMIEILEPHQRADALVQRVLVADHGVRAMQALHRSGILPQVAAV